MASEVFSAREGVNPQNAFGNVSVRTRQAAFANRQSASRLNNMTVAAQDEGIYRRAGQLIDAVRDNPNLTERQRERYYRRIRNAERNMRDTAYYNSL